MLSTKVLQFILFNFFIYLLSQGTELYTLPDVYIKLMLFMVSILLIGIILSVSQIKIWLAVYLDVIIV